MFSVEKNVTKLNICEKDFDYSCQGKDYEWYLNGDLFYIIKKRSIIKKDDLNNDLIDKIFKDCNFDPMSIKDTLEGHYICVIKELDKIKIFGDKFNRRNLFFYEDKGIVHCDTKLTKLLIDKSGKKIDKMNIISYFLIGYGHATTTIFKKIRRLGYQEYLLFKNNNLSVVKNFKPTKIQKYGGKKLIEFEELFKESISTRMSEDGTNWIMSSGGWDSTIILDTLLKLNNKVKSAIFEVQLRDGQILNKFEVEKFKEISRHYNLQSHILNVDLNDKKLVEKWKDYATLCFENHIFQWPLNHFGMSDFIFQKDPFVKSIFNGECADSFQNFGFSQYQSLHSGNNDFDEYADKMKTYLYGPTFFSKVDDGSFKNDVIYKIFKKMNDDVTFNEEDDYRNIMLSFIYSPSRLPFTLSGKPPFFKEEILQNFFKKAYENYFESYYSLLNSKNIYSILIALYADFHFKAPSVLMSVHSIENTGVTPALPFFDIRLSEYFAKMPEGWGRGLNPNCAKYPEKTMAMKSKTFPLHIVDRDTTHSYISEIDKSINPGYEYYCNSVIGDYFRGLLSDKNSLEFLEDIKEIDMEYVNSIRNDFIDEKLSMKDFSFMTKICIVTSIMKEYFQN